MSLLLPETGLVFWMLIAFGIVFFILAKFGWPVIIKMTDKRADFIDNSLKSAKEINQKMENLKVEMQLLIDNSHEEQGRLLKEAAEYRKTIIHEARLKAQNEAIKIIDEARTHIQIERENILNEIRIQVAGLSVKIAEKVVRNELSDNNKQISMIEKMIEEATALKN
jgi:F-type H+-transporting ATPase subunit b